jgi:hypothetical protein
MTRLNQFFRDAGSAISHSPEVRKAVSQAVTQLEQQIERDVSRGLSLFIDGFEAVKPKAAAVSLATPPPASRASDADFVKGLYRDLLGREPELDGYHSHMRGLETGVSREELRQIFLNSPEYREKKAAEASPSPAPVVPDPIQTQPSPIAGAPDFDAAYPQIKRMNVVASAEASPGEQQVFWTQALVRGRANNGWTVTQDEVKALVQKSAGDIDNYSKEMIRAVAAKLHRPLTREEACVVIYKVQHQYRAEVDALMQEYGSRPDSPTWT